MKTKLVLVLGVLLLIGFMTCDNGTGGNTDEAFEGTWLGTLNSKILKIVMANNIFKEYFVIDGTDYQIVRGTYTTVANNVTIKVTELNDGILKGGDTDDWKSYEDSTEKNNVGPTGDTVTGTITGKNLLLSNGITFAKQM